MRIIPRTARSPARRRAGLFLGSFLVACSRRESMPVRSERNAQESLSVVHWLQPFSTHWLRFHRKRATGSRKIPPADEPLTGFGNQAIRLIRSVFLSAGVLPATVESEF